MTVAELKAKFAEFIEHQGLDDEDEAPAALFVDLQDELDDWANEEE